MLRKPSEEELYFADIQRRLEEGYHLAAQSDPSLIEDERTSDGRNLRYILEKYDNISDQTDFPGNKFPKGRILLED